MKRWLKRLLGSIVAAVAIVLVLGWLTMRASLPDIDGEVVIDGLDANATIERDADGIPTITASTRTDLAFATGFAHGQDRFFQMDLIRRQSAGELSELIGATTAAVDERFRWHRFRSRARENIANISAADMDLLQRYSDGVNAGLASLGAKPFEYYVLRAEPELWLPEDTVLVSYTMYTRLNDERASRDVQRGVAHLALPQEMYDWLYPQGTSWDAPLMGEVRPHAAIPGAEILSLRDSVADVPPLTEQGEPYLNGSNNWAVSGDLTSTGRAMVSNDMHLGLAAPNIYYQARLVLEGDAPRDVIGVILPGTPFVVAGSNTKIAWAYTNTWGDWSDAVILRPGVDPGTYKTPDGDKPFVEYQERIEIKGGNPIEMTIRETIWGPVDDSANYPDGEIAVSWIGHGAGAVNMRIIGLESAESVFAAVDIANRMGIPPQNFVTGDSAGNIAWTVAGTIPARTEFNPMLPADWSETPGWTGWLAADDYPRIINPENGRLWSANARVVDGDALKVVGDGGYALGARARQIRDALLAKESFSPADMLAIQIDDRALFLSPWRELLLQVLTDEAVADDDQLAEYRRLVDNWIPRATPESVGYRLVRAFRLGVQERVFRAVMAPLRDVYGDNVRLRRSRQFEAPLWSLVTEQPEHLLPANYTNWQQLMLDVVQESIAYFAENFAGTLADRTWGERNTARIQHQLSRGMPMLSTFLDMPDDQLNGDVNMPRAQGQTFGASERFSVSPGDEANALMHMPSGQSGHPLSDFYRRGHDDWVHGRPSPFLPGETQHKLTLQPAP